MNLLRIFFLLAFAMPAAAIAAPLEVVAHQGTSAGASVPDLDLLLCPDNGGACIAAQTTDAKGHAAFTLPDTGEFVVRAVLPCGPVEWAVSRDPAKPAKLDVALPATGTLRVAVEGTGADGSASPVPDTDFQFTVASTRKAGGIVVPFMGQVTTSASGSVDVCFEADRTFNLTLQHPSYQAASLVAQKVEAGRVTSARVKLRRR